MLIIVCMLSGKGINSQNFTVGLTNEHPLVSSPMPGAYAVCGQYPGAVPKGATVKLECSDTVNPQPVRYVIVQFPTTERVRFCEVEVYTPEGGTVRFKVQSPLFRHVMELLNPAVASVLVCILLFPTISTYGTFSVNVL